MLSLRNPAAGKQAKRSWGNTPTIRKGKRMDLGHRFIHSQFALGSFRKITTGTQALSNSTVLVFTRGVRLDNCKTSNPTTWFASL